MRVGIVGAGPAGALLAERLASAGAHATLFDPSHPREKPCGGGLTLKALRLLPSPPKGDPLPARFVDRCRFESGTGEDVQLRLEHPVAIASRRELDAWVLRRALAAGAQHRPERVVAVSDDGRLTSTGGEHAFDVIVGADGAGSLVRRRLLGATPTKRLMMAAGWFAPGDAPMLVRFVPGLAGYLWLFPRNGHVGVGICAPLAALPTRALLERLEREIESSFPWLARGAARRYAHTIPSPSADPGSLREIAGERWALVGDAAALADPITGEGIYFALRSAELLARSLLSSGSPAAYPEALLADCGAELVRAAELHERFYAPGFTGRMLRYAGRSGAVRRVMEELVLGDQGYVGLKRRLLRAGPGFLVDSARALLARGPTSAC